MFGFLKYWTSSKKLLGCWHQIISPGQDPVEIEFKSDGKMIYAIQSKDHWSIIKLIYKVESDILITDQPSHPKEERTRFHIENGTLSLMFNGRLSSYRKGTKQSPEA
jgi:hypothetical protein